MISVYKLKPAFQKLLKPTLAFLHKNGVTANQITVTSIILSLGIGICFWFANEHHWMFWVLPAGLFLRMALNAMDGMMARIYDQQSKKGEILNEIGDIVSDFFIFLPLLRHEPELTYLIVSFMCLSIINEFAGILGKIVSGERRYEGPMGKSDRALIIGVYGILKILSVPLTGYIYYVFIVIIVLLLISTWIRVSKSLKI